MMPKNLTDLQFNALKLFRDLSPASGIVKLNPYVKEKVWLNRHKVSRKAIAALRKRGLIEFGGKGSYRITPSGLLEYKRIEKGELP